MASKPGYDPKVLRSLTVSTIRMLCKPTSLGETGYVLKFTGPAMVRLPQIIEVFPSARSLFMYRDTVKVIWLHHFDDDYCAEQGVIFGQGHTSHYSCKMWQINWLIKNGTAWIVGHFVHIEQVAKIRKHCDKCICLSPIGVQISAE